MRPVFQDNDFNCFQACLASLFETDLHDMPDFFRDGAENFDKAWQEWSSQNPEYSLLDVTYHTDVFDRFLKDQYVIVTGRSPRDSNILHSVIYRNGQLMHDPYKQESIGVTNPSLITLVIKKFM